MQFAFRIDRIEEYLNCRTWYFPLHRHLRLLYLLGFILAFGNLFPLLNAGTVSDDATVGHNEDTKVELYGWYEFKVADTASDAVLQKLQTKTYVDSTSNSVVTKTLAHEIGRYTASEADQMAAANTWQRCAVFLMARESRINNLLQTVPLRGSNVQSYRLHLIVPNGYEVYYRAAGSTGVFTPGSILDGNVFESAAFQLVIHKIDEAGALPGRVATANTDNGEIRMGLGFLPNGKSAGFLDFLPVLDYQFAWNGGLDAFWGRPLGSYNLRCVTLGDEAETVYQDIPGERSGGYYLSEVKGIRQVITPQAVVDVCRDGYDLLVKYYLPSQKGSRITSEANAYGSGTFEYVAGIGPYAMSGDPFVTYRMQWTQQIEEPNIRSIITTTRTEGSDVKAMTTMVEDYYEIVPESSYLWECPICNGLGGNFCPMTESCSNCGGSGQVRLVSECTNCGGSGSDFSCDVCGTCGGSGSVDIGGAEAQQKPCDTCGGSGIVNQRVIVCGTCGGSGNMVDVAAVCGTCDGSGEMWCSICNGSGYVVCSSCGGFASEDRTIPKHLDPDSPFQDRYITVSGFGSKYSAHSVTDYSGYSFTEGNLPSGWVYGKLVSPVTYYAAGSEASLSGRTYMGPFPNFSQYAYTIWDGTPYVQFWYLGTTQKLTSVTDGNQGLLTQYGYYRLGLSDSLHDTHHGRMKWQTNSDGSWGMYDYATELSSLGQVTKTVSAYLDATKPTDLPTATSASGYRITTMTYAEDWEGVKRLPDTVTTTADGQQVGYTDNDYSAGTANDQPLWVTTSKSYTSSGSYLTSISKVYEGLTVSSWLRGLPYSSEGPDGSKETVAYHRGTYDASTKTFSKSDTGLGFRSVVFKGRASSSSGGTALSTYDEATIDTIYMIPNVSTAEVTLRDARAFTVRSETLLYTGSGFTLIDSSDMQYDDAGNLTRREKLNGALYEATYANGQKTSEKDEQGLTTTFHYDSEGRVDYTNRETFGDVPALRTAFTYDDENRILSTTIGSDGAEQIVSSKTYDKSGRVLTETNEGLTTTYTYTVVDGILTSTTVTLPGGATRILENYRDGRPKSVTGTAGIAEYYSYGIESGQETVTKYLGSDGSDRWTKTYADWAGRTVKTQSSSTGGTLEATSTYNSLGQLGSTQIDTLASTNYSYDGNGVMTSYTQSDRKNSFTYGYRTDGDVWSRYGGDSSTLWDYSETKAYPTDAGQTQTRTWTRVTNFNRVSGPSGVTGTAIAESVAADANGNRAVTQTFLDRDNAKVTTVVWSPFAAQPSISIAVAGRLISQTSSAGVTVTYGYDALGRATSSTDRTGTSSVAYYTGTTRLHTVTDARSITQHTYTYDSAGRLSQDKTPKIVSGSTSGTNASSFAYNDRGQLVLVSGDVPYPVKYEYDAYGDRTAQYTYRDASLIGSTSGDKTAFAYYASNGLLNTKTDPEGKAVTYTYNLRGQLKTRTWARGVVTTYAYNDATTGDLASATYSDGTPTIRYTYDCLGRLSAVTDATGTRNFTYRTTDLKPASETFGWPSVTATRQLTNQYDSTTGRFIGFSLDNSGTSEHALTYGFNSINGRLSSITSGAGAFSYSYLANSNLISGVARGSYAQTRTYETNRNLLTTLATTTQAGTLASYTYACDDLGRRTSVDQSGLVYNPYTLGTQLLRTVYGYDDRNEVTSATTTAGGTTLPGRTFGYAFDPIGNRTQDSLDGNANSYASNALNQYTSRATPSYLPVTGTANRTGGASLTINNTDVSSWVNDYFHLAVGKGGATSAYYQTFAFAATSGSVTQSDTVYAMVRPVNEAFSYDDDGNLLSDSLWVYAYDGENRLQSMHSVLTDNTGHHLAAAFIYDYMGRRVSKQVLSFDGTATAPSNYSQRTRTFYAYQGWTLLAEYDASLTLARRYTFGLDLSGSLGGAGDIGGLLAIEDKTTSYAGTYLAAFDGNGNLMGLADSSTGALAAAYEYDPFGNVLRATGTYAKQNPFRFAGKYFDTETGLSYYGFRYYCASTGRFVNRDPLEERGGWNLYSGLKFGASNPFAGASGVEGTSWSTEWEQAQSRQLSNSSLPHTTQAVSFDSKKNSGLPGSSEQDQKTYTANATGHYAQGGAPGTGPSAPSMSGGNPAAGNADINLYCYAGNDPVNSIDALGLKIESGVDENGSRYIRDVPDLAEQTPAAPIVRQEIPSFTDQTITKLRNAKKNLENKFENSSFSKAGKANKNSIEAMANFISDASEGKEVDANLAQGRRWSAGANAAGVLVNDVGVPLTGLVYKSNPAAVMFVSGADPIGTVKDAAVGKILPTVEAATEPGSVPNKVINAVGKGMEINKKVEKAKSNLKKVNELTKDPAEKPKPAPAPENKNQPKRNFWDRLFDIKRK